MDIERGLYETLITESLARRIERLDDSVQASQRPLRREEAGDRLALHLSRCIIRAIEGLPARDRVSRGVELAQRLIHEIDQLQATDDPSGDTLPDAPHVLHAISRTLPDGRAQSIAEPLTPLLDTTLLTNSPGEPRVGQELATEIESADRIDVVMAFVRFSGIRPLLEPLRRHIESGRQLRLLTTVYTGSTEARALDILTEVGAQVKISYDIGRTRLHAKAWLFHRESGYSTSYIGSSNLTHMAQVDGLEWNVRASAARNPDVVDKVRAVFEAYWQDGDFADYDADEFARHQQREQRVDGIVLPPTEVSPWPFQARLLEQIAMARIQGHHRNLLVAATGTGKTVMAALDYASLRKNNALPSLLFVAHRKEILTQAQATFRHVLRQASFGELWVDNQVPSQFRHVFASIQTLNASTLARLESDHFDVLIIDEFHHAAATSYQRLLDHLTPAELLGLTATPERSDGLDVLNAFEGRIAAELRLWDAIDQQRLAPFMYFGIADNTDFSNVTWNRSRGYDVEGLTNVLTANDAIANQVLQQLNDHVDDIQNIRALGFCVSVRHARFMARVFTEAGLRSTAIWGDSSAVERRAALNALENGELRVLFSVDLFNEGVDVPSVDTLLMLRPTQSGTLFLQQLGRGLRLHESKRVCTVLDFVGQHRKEFRYDQRFRALLGGSRRQVQQQVQSGFPFLPAGCHLSLDRVAAERVLQSLKNALPTTWPQRIRELASLADPDISLQRFLDESGLELDDIYTANRCWSDLKEAAGLAVAEKGHTESILRRAIGRMQHVDNRARLTSWIEWLTQPERINPDNLPVEQHRLLRMLVTSIVEKACEKETSLADGWQLLIDHERVVQELIELFTILLLRPTHLHHVIDTPTAVPLQVHARYTRVEILAACGIGGGARASQWREGVYWAKQLGADILAFTLDKTEGGFSPTTRYRDYAISRTLIHWESQNATRANSPTGLRYQHHAKEGQVILLFARERSDDRAFWFLGPGRYVSHEGDRPMAITWKLDHALPGDLYAGFAAAVA